MDFEWIILFILIPFLVIITVGLIIAAFYERKQKKSSKLKTKDWVAERRLKGKGEATGYVACSDCGKLCNPDQMSTFGYWTTLYSFGGMELGGGMGAMEDTNWEEAIPGKKPTHTYSFLKDVCPACATRLRNIKKTSEEEFKIVGLVLLVFLLLILLKILFF
jgi:hypothetical protein